MLAVEECIYSLRDLLAYRDSFCGMVRAIKVAHAHRLAARLLSLLEQISTPELQAEDSTPREEYCRFRSRYFHLNGASIGEDSTGVWWERPARAGKWRKCADQAKARMLCRSPGWRAVSITAI